MMTDNFKDYAQFLLEEKLDEFCHTQIGLLQKYQLEMLAEFNALDEETKLSLARSEQSEFLLSIINDTAFERLSENLEKWERNELDMDNQMIGEVEIDALLGTQKHTLVKFLSDYSPDPVVISDLCQRIVEFYGHFERESYKSYARVKNNALEEVKRLSETVTKKNEEILSSLRYASSIQQVLMPNTSEFQKHNLSAFLLYKPKDIVSGDFFWSYSTEDSLLFCVGDCTGHGVPGALLTAVSLGLLQRAVIEHNLKEPGAILDFLHDQFVQRFDKEHSSSEGVDVMLCKADFSKQELRISSASSIGYLLKKDGSLIELQLSRKSVGSRVFKETYEEHVFPLSEIQQVFLQSDGYRDQIGEKAGKPFRRKNYRSLLESLKEKSSNEQRRILESTLSDWQGAEEQIDDICVLGVKLT